MSGTDWRVATFSPDKMSALHSWMVPEKKANTSSGGSEVRQLSRYDFWSSANVWFRSNNILENGALILLLYYLKFGAFVPEPLQKKKNLKITLKPSSQSSGFAPKHN
jgi:hypothetical protein